MGETVEELERELEEFSASADISSLVKLKEFCIIYDSSAADMVASWIAFSATRNCGMDPTVELLETFEKEELLKAIKSTKHRKSQVSKNRSSGGYDSTPYRHDVYEAKEVHTPENKRPVHATKVNQFSPNSFSPMTITPSAKYASRKAPGEVVASYGNTEGMSWVSSQPTSCIISNYDESSTLKTRYTYMFEKLRDYASILNDMIEDMASHYKTAYDVLEWAHVHMPMMDASPVCGRICSDSSGRLNSQSLLLEGSHETSSGQVVSLDVSQLEKYAFFPGQVIAGEGINSTGKKLTLKSLYEDTVPSFPKECPNFANINDCLSVVVAAGPFTTSDSLSYEPLADLIKYVKANKPQLCILCGPFVDIKQKELQVGNLPETYQELFIRLVTTIMNNLEEMDTKVVLVSSDRDVHHDPVYPSPPYDVKLNFKNLLLASNPCLLNVNGVIIGVTSTDILIHLGKEEVNLSTQSDRLGRLCRHILAQRNFYPLYPPSEDVNIDYLHFESHCFLPVTPHVLIIPSDLRYFIKNVNGCCCVNPERLTKSLVGGTFARLKIQAVEPNSYSGPLVEHIKGNIVRI